MMRHIFSRGLAVTGAVIAALVVAAPASAATPQVLVSVDGTAFSSNLSTQLFDDLDLIVPGDSMSSSMWVRNDSPDTALVRVAITDLVIPSTQFGAAVTLSSTMNGFTHMASLGSLSNCAVIV